MSQDLTSNPIGFLAGADLSASSNLYKAVKYDSTAGGVILAGAGEHGIGILHSLGVTGAEVAVAVDRTSKYVAGNTITKGNKLICGASGVLVSTTLTTGIWAIGIALEDAVANDIAEMFIEKANY